MFQRLQISEGGRQKKALLIDAMAKMITNAAARGHIPSAMLALSFFRSTDADQALEKLRVEDLTDRQLEILISRLAE